MIKVAATEFSKNFGQFREIVQREPVEVTSHDRVTGYFLSPVEFNEYISLKALKQKAFAVSELSIETINQIAASQMSSEHAHLDSLLDE